jgi:arginine repressor
MIDQTLARRNLTQAEHAVALGRSHIERQTQIVAELERDGHDATQARLLLATFRDLQVEHEAHRDRLLSELHES